MKFAAVLAIFLLLGAFSADGIWHKPNLNICWWKLKWCLKKCHPWDWKCKKKCFWKYKWCLKKFGGHFPYGPGSSGGYGFDGYGGDDYNFGYGHRKYKY
uniref:Lysine-rich matrix protein 3 n=1 Tax=Pinctada fucata TaxID=50426 RepID=C4TPD1_PINFU|nr:lysine-rich matrix protein 3 [Pinctada fucata]